jgi:hypothetical protein
VNAGEARAAQLAATVRLPSRLVATFPVTPRACVAVTRDLVVVLAVPDGLAEVSPGELVDAVQAAEDWLAGHRAGLAAELAGTVRPCTVLAAEIGGHQFWCTAGPSGHKLPHVYTKAAREPAAPAATTTERGTA